MSDKNRYVNFIYFFDFSLDNFLITGYTTFSERGYNKNNYEGEKWL